MEKRCRTLENLGITSSSQARIAVFGATSVLARDFLSCTSFPKSAFACFARNRSRLVDLDLDLKLKTYEEFKTQEPYSAIVNFVGYGSPARAIDEAARILEVTRRFDSLALDYLRIHPETAYIFISSGSSKVFSDIWSAPQDLRLIEGRLGSEDFYPAAKYEAETRHRNLTDLKVCDIRVFNYVSPRQSLDDRFFFTDLARAYLSDSELQTSPIDILRDYADKDNLTQMIDLCLATPINAAFDLFTQKSVYKFELLEHLSQSLGLKFRVDDESKPLSPTGLKVEYVPTDFGAKSLGYSPKADSIENVIRSLLEFKRSGKYV